MKVAISGASGFIGAHTVAAFLARGATVIGFDNLSRRGCVDNLAWLGTLKGDFRFHHTDIRNEADLRQMFGKYHDIDVVIHLAGQVAVTTSVSNPRLDFESNALGTFNMLEAVRHHCPSAAFLFASTNKVYGGLEGAHVIEREGRYAYRDHPDGINEETPIDFHSPYGCSKGSADQYVRDYHRIYGLKTVVFRQSCIYGTRQFGVEDQGWIAWFTIATVLGLPITIYGDGKQVRDVLWVDDLVALYIRAIEKIDRAAGQIYNAGGGSVNTLSLIDLVNTLTKLSAKPITPAPAPWRPGDQRVFIANIDKVRQELGWQPKVAPQEGIAKLLEWTMANKELLRHVLQVKNA